MSESVNQSGLDAQLETALYDDDPVARDRARQLISEQATSEFIDALVPCLNAPRRMTRRRAARILSDILPKKIRETLVTTLHDAEQPTRIRLAVARILLAHAEQVEPAFSQGLTDPDPRVRRACATQLTPIPCLIRGLTDEDDDVAERCAHALLTLEATVSAEHLEATSTRRATMTPSLLRLLIKYAPGATQAQALARSGDPIALAHSSDPQLFLDRLEGDPVVSAWGLSRLDSLPDNLHLHPDPRVRAAVARAQSTSEQVLAMLKNDADPGVQWLARRAAMREYSETAMRSRAQPHDALSSPSAKPPYGLRPGDELPQVQRRKAAVALCQARFDINLGVAMRSAEAAGVEGVYFVGRSDFVRSPARGADLALPIHACHDAAELIRAARTRGYQIVAIQQTAGSVPYHRADYPPNPIFVVGSEDTGMPVALREAADLNVEIPQFGIIDSLNVATALTVVLFHWRVHVEAE